MIENKSSEVIPTDVWNSVVKRVTEHRGNQWKRKEFIRKCFFSRYSPFVSNTNHA